jgi:hypothetical protein
MNHLRSRLEVGFLFSAGLMVERGWQDPQRRIYDLTFRSLIILHYAEKQAA